MLVIDHFAGECVGPQLRAIRSHLINRPAAQGKSVSPALGRVSSVVVFRFRVYEMACRSFARKGIQKSTKFFLASAPCTLLLEAIASWKSRCETLHLEARLCHSGRPGSRS